MWPVPPNVHHQVPYPAAAAAAAAAAGAPLSAAGGFVRPAIPPVTALAMHPGIPMHRPESIAVACDHTMGLEKKLWQNISDDYYFKELSRFLTTDDLLEEAKVEADHVNAWGDMRGGYKRADNMVLGTKKSECNEHEHRSPTKLWCILYRIFQLGVTEAQLRNMLSKNSKAMIRCLGVLFVRFTQPPSDLLKYLSDLITDSETSVVIVPGKAGASTTMDKFCRNVLLEPKYLETRFPRIPEKFLREIRKELGEEVTTAAEEAERERRRRRNDDDDIGPRSTLKRRRSGRLDLDDDDVPAKKTLTPREREQQKESKWREERERRLDRLKDEDRPRRRRADSHEDRRRRGDSHEDRRRRADSHEDRRRRRSDSHEDRRRRRSDSHGDRRRRSSRTPPPEDDSRRTHRSESHDDKKRKESRVGDEKPPADHGPQTKQQKAAINALAKISKLLKK